MPWIVTNIDWILIVCGALTMTMIMPFLAPRFAANYLFGEAPEGPVAEMVLRSWGQLIFSAGLLLIWAAYDESARLPILLFSIFGKATFIALVMARGRRWLGRPAMQAAVGDTVMVVLFAWYLLAAH